MKLPLFNKRKTNEWSGCQGGDWNYCIQIASTDKNPKVLKFCGQNTKAIHRIIGNLISEDIGWPEVENIWMEPLTTWDKKGKYKLYETEYFKSISNSLII